MRRVPFPFPFRLSAGRPAGALLAGLLVAMLLGGWGWSRPSSVENPQAAAAVRALTGDRVDAAASLPADFATVAGYRPVPVGGRILRADGGCSSPWGQTRYGFGNACKQHDLGYDLLRYASAKHQPLGAWARRAIDAHFARDVEARCLDLRCRGAARFYTGAVEFNSWRQGWGVPVVESTPALAMPGVAGFGVASATLLGLRRRPLLRRDRARTARWSGTVRPWLEARAGRLLVAAAVLALCLQPVQVPRPVWVQAVIGGAAAAQAYLFAGLFARWSGSLRRSVGRLRNRARARAGGAFGGPFGGPEVGPGAVLAVASGLLGLAAVSSSVGQLRMDAAVGRASWSMLPQLSATPAAVLVATVFVLILSGLGWMIRRALRALIRPGRLARGLTVSLLLPGLALGVVAPAAASTSAPTSSPVSSASAPAVGSSDVGAKGRDFLAGVDGGADGAELRGVRPLRIYVGRDQAASAQARAELAVAELRAAGGFDRSVLLVAVPTGSGWVNPAAVSALERVADGDVATVAVQYAASPSWVSYVRGGEGVQADVRALLDAVHAEVLRRPAGERPKVLVYGESLGAWGALKAYPSNDQLMDRVDGALWVGVPPGVELPTGAAAARQLVVIHRDDPVPAWSPELMVHPTPGYSHGWLPGVSFWRVTADVISANGTPMGHGHRYGPELAGAWAGLTAASPASAAQPSITLPAAPPPARR